MPKRIFRVVLTVVVESFLALAISSLALAGFVDGSTGTSRAAQETQQAKEIDHSGPTFTVAKTDSKIKVDGLLDEEAWSKAAVIPILYEYQPGDNAPPPVKTECLVTYNADYLYIGFRAYDPEPSQIRAHLMDRDSIDTFIQDDHLWFVLDTFNDERRCFQFRVNPLGVQADAIFSELEGYEDFSWDSIWDSAGKITAWGYAVEAAVPFNQLRFPRTQDVQTWGFSAERSYPRNVRHRIASHRRDRNVACIICQFNKITGIQGITPGRNLELDPTLTGNRTDQRPGFIEGPLEMGKAQVEPGITARWGITPDLILNGTANPDFSQVEADVAQLEVNTRFALYYPEKRPFFLEGADFFLTPFNAVFTRTVADPAGGVKITGKIGRNAIGVFGAYDRINNLIFPSNQGSMSGTLEQDVKSGVFRFRRDVGQNSTFGVLYAGRAAEDYYNHVAGFDGFFRFSPTKSLRLQYLHSETQYPQQTALDFGQPAKGFGGDGFTAEFQHTGRDWLVGLAYRDLSPGFRADSGYIPRVDVRRADGALNRIFWGKEGGWYTQLFVGVQGYVVYDHQGNLTDQMIMLGAEGRGPLQSEFGLLAFHSKELYQGILFDLTKAGFDAAFKPGSGLSFGVEGVIGDSVDYNNVRRADQVAIASSAEFGLGRHVNLIFTHTLERLSLRGKEIYTANLPQLRLIYNINVRTFVRAIVQYLDVRRNPELYVFPVSAKDNTLFTQFLFSYKLNPQTVLFLGYSDNYFGMQGIDLIQTDRTFFVKLGYAWTD